MTALARRPPRPWGGRGSRMNAHNRRILHTGAAVLGMTALGAVGSSVAFADTGNGLVGTPDHYDGTEHPPTYDSAGLPRDTVENPAHQSFEMPTITESSIGPSTQDAESNNGTPPN